MSASDLCFYNFKTRKPAEVNWYLHNKVGCTKITRDRSNYRFSSSDSRGIVYLPPPGPPQPANEIDPISARTWPRTSS
jgi:hypothetical protein